MVSHLRIILPSKWMIIILDEKEFDDKYNRNDLVMSIKVIYDIIFIIND